MNTGKTLHTEINVLKNRLRTAQENELTYRRFFEQSTSCSMFFDSQGNIRDANKSICTLFGYSKEEFLQLNIIDLQAKDQNSSEKANNALNELFVKGKAEFANEFITKSGETFRAVAAAAIVDNPCKKIYHARFGRLPKNTLVAKSMDEEENCYKTLFETAYDAIFFIDGDKFVFTNISAVKLFGCASKEDFLNKPPWHFSPKKQPDGKSSKQLAQHYIEAAYAGQPQRFSWVHAKQDGTRFEAEVSLNAVRIKEHVFVQAIVRDISIYSEKERLIKANEEKLKTQNMRYATLLSNLNGMVYRCKNDPDWTMLFVSDGCIELTGYKPEHLIQNKTMAYNDLILPKYQEYVWGEIQEQLTKNEHYEIEYEIMTAGGEKKMVWERGAGVFDADKNLLFLEGIVSDITRRKQAEIKAQKLSTAIENSPETIIITDKQGIIEYANPTFEKLTGYSINETIGQNPRLLQSGIHAISFYKNLWNTILTGNSWYGEFLNKKKNGDLYWEKASISPIFNQANEITHFVAVKEDITADKKLLADLKLAKEKAEESDRLKSAFLANMSHEIRTPMNGILGFADLLKEPNLSGDEQKKYINVIERSGERMLNIINDLIDISKIEAGQMEVVISPTNITEMAGFLSAFFKPEIDKKGLKFITRFPSGNQPLIINTDSVKVYAIATNLLKNAIKYTRRGNIEFGFDVVQAETHSNAPRFAQFYIKDTGIGIPEERLEAVFERFIQADIEDKHAMEGAGLGLAICKAYAAMLNGKIWVESVYGEGSKFYCTIPDQAVEIKKPEPAGLQLKDDRKTNDKQFKILVAEDDKTSEMHLSFLLSNMANEILHAHTGTETVDMCLKNKDIDLVLMDIKMPAMDGYTATRKIREFNQNIIIIAQTAYALAGDREKALQSGCNDYIAKPIKKELLNEIIAKYFKL